MPRYTQFGAKKPYVGLREQPEEAWTSRVLVAEPDADPNDFHMIKIALSSPGFVYFGTKIYRPNDSL